MTKKRSDIFGAEQKLLLYRDAIQELSKARELALKFVEMVDNINDPNVIREMLTSVIFLQGALTQYAVKSAQISLLSQNEKEDKSKE